MPLGDRIGDKSESRYCGVETDFDDDMPNLLYRNISTGGFDFVVSTLMDPSYRPSLVKKDESKSLALPFAGSDLVLSPSQWSGHVVGKISSWIDLDSEDEKLRADSEITLKQEIAWASHLSLQACLLPVPKGTAFSNYARCVNQILQSLNNMQLWLRIPLVKADEDDVSDEKSEKSGLADSWELWNSFRYLCEHHSQLSVALEVLSSLPSANSLGRWIGEPVKAALINTNSFLTNARGYPCLSKRHQKLLTSFFNYSVQIVLCGKGAQTSGSSFKSADHSDGVEKHPLKSYLDYVGYLYQRMDPLPYCASADVRTETKSVTGSAEVDVSAIKEKKKKKKKDKNCEVSKDIASEDAQLKADKVMESDNSKEHSSVNKRKKKIGEIGNGDASKDMPSEKVGSGAKKGQSQGISSYAASENIQTVDADIGSDCKKKDKRKKKKVLSKNIDGHSVEKVDEKEGFKSLKKRKRDVEAADSSEKTNSERKRVRFSDNVEVFTFPEHLKYRKLSSEGDVVQGKRYTAEEDAKIMQAIDDYIVEHGLAKNVADKDLDENWKNARNMIMNCKEHSKLKGCWKDISLAIPWRTLESIYQRAHLIYERAEDRKWTKEEIDMILSFHEKNGPKWRELGDFLGKSRKHVKDAYRRNKLSGEKKGAWTQDEYQKLFDLVNHDIILKAVQEKKVKHGMLRDNIAWGAISEAIGTRASPTCCNKWYYQLCSSMVVEGKWSDTDDYKLVDALCNQDACCIEDVEWDSLLEHRSGDLCRRRWAEMARNLGEYRQKPFLEQVEVLHQRYDRELLEAREAYEKKDPVDV